MKNSYVVMAISATLWLFGCASTKDLSQMEANVDTASEGDFGRCMEAVYAGAVQLGKAQEVLREGQNKQGKISESEYEKGLKASEKAVRDRQAAEQACNARVAAVEQQVQIAEQQVQSTERQLRRTKEVLRGVTFAEGSARLTQGGKATLDVVANRLLREPTQVELQGHTSNTGSLEFNMKLSEQRAEAVREYLVSQGVPADSITAKGYGPTQPVDSNDTPEGRRANQRVELSYVEEIRIR